MYPIAFTISPKNLEKIEYQELFGNFLTKYGEWCYVEEVSDNGHKHIHGGVLSKSNISKFGQALRRSWERLDPDYSAITIKKHEGVKTWYKGALRDDMTWWQYITKTGVVPVLSQNFPTTDDVLYPLLATDVPIAERRSKQMWKLFHKLNDLCDEHDVIIDDSVFGCRRAMNVLAWVHRAYECPLDSRKFSQVAVGWWKFRTQYSGDCAKDPEETYQICDKCNKRKRGSEMSEYCESVCNRILNS